MSAPKLSFYGDDFTGSTDALESLALAGLRTMLFTSVPTRQQLAEHRDLEALGVAGMTRSMPPDEMERTLRPALTALRELAAPIVHYKVCSTFDSSPTVGSIGRVIDVAWEIFEPAFIPVLVGAPALGRYCLFGNLFARCGPESEPYRLDRHPSMSRHPVTPMNEADLRVHLSKQTRKRIGLFDIVQLTSGDADERFERLLQSEPQVVLIDVLDESQLATIGGILSRHATTDRPLFVVGSSAVEAALCLHWKTQPAAPRPVAPVTPLLAVCGSCSPVTAAQIERAVNDGFVPVTMDTKAVGAVTDLLNSGRCVVLHTQGLSGQEQNIGEKLSRTVHDVMERTSLLRVVIAGGDTSGHVARALGIQSLQVVAPLTPGAPLCRAAAPGSAADGVEFVFKGGQIGPVDFFSVVRNGRGT